MEEELPSEYDAIVLGTGLPESITAAALARVGFKVLHLDRNDHYSGQWTTFTFDSLLSWIERNQAQASAQVDTPASSSSSETDDFLVPVPSQVAVIHNAVTGLYFRNKSKEDCYEKTSADSSPSPASDVCGAKKLDTEPKEEKSTESEENVLSNVDSKKPNESVARGQCKSDDNTANTTPATGGNELQNSDLNEGASRVESDQQLPSTSSEMTATQTVTTEETPSADTLPSVTESETDVAAESSSNIFRPRARQARPPISTNMAFDDLKPYFRRFNIDLSPKLLFSRGPLVEALISANISHYAEFKAVTCILTYLNNKAEDVPCSRADVFSSKLISVIEKRMLMKFLTFCVEFEQHPEEYKEFLDKTFLEFLQSRRLTPNLQHFALYAIAMATSATSTLDGLKATQNFLKSLGRYGNTPFIWPLYGSGEMPQAFCRMCAVFGGLYCLRRSASALTIDRDSNNCTGIISDGQHLKAKWIIMEYSYVPTSYKTSTQSSVSRAVFITNKSLKPGADEYITLLTVPPQTENGPLVRLIELGPTTMACPQGLFVVHLICEGQLSAQEDLEGVAKQLFCIPAQPGDFSSADEKPIVLWSLYFNQLAPDVSMCTTGLPGNIMVTSLPGIALGFEQTMDEAKRIFKKICPEEEFLPAVPNPEDILWDEMLPVADSSETGFGPESEAGQSSLRGASEDSTEETGEGETSGDASEEQGESGVSENTAKEPGESGASENTAKGPGESGTSENTAKKPGESGELDENTEEPGSSES